MLYEHKLFPHRMWEWVLLYYKSICQQCRVVEHSAVFFWLIIQWS